MIMLNWELWRTLKLEWSRAKLVVPPFVLCLLYLAIKASAAEKGAAETALAAIGGGIIGLSCIYGCGRAYRSTVFETRERTWDLQKLSVMTPWAMTWGKFFGSVSTSWYVVAIGLPFVVPAMPPSQKLWGTLLIVCGVLFAQSIGFFAGLAAIQRQSFVSGRPGIISVVVLFGLLQLMSVAVSALIRQKHPGEIAWFWLHAPLDVFFTVSLFVFFCWMLLGAWRLMKREFQEPMFPWALPASLAFAMLYLAGLPHGIKLSVPFGAAATYLILLSEPLTIVMVRKAIASLKRGDPAQALRVLPLWIMSFAVTVCAFGILIIFHPVADYGGFDYEMYLLLVSAALVLTVRDACIISGLKMMEARPGQSEVPSVIILIALWGLLPFVVSAFKASSLLVLFYPWAVDRSAKLSGPVICFIPALLYLAYCLKRANARISASGGNSYGGTQSLASEK